MTLVISPSGVRFQKEAMTTQTQTWLNEMAFAPQSQLLDDITLIHMQGIQSMHLNRMQFYTHFITLLLLNGKSIKAAGLGALAGNNPAPKRIIKINKPKIKILSYLLTLVFSKLMCFYSLCGRKIEFLQNLLKRNNLHKLTVKVTSSR